MRICTKCKVEKSISGFHKSKSHKEGYYPRCKECVREAVREHRLAHPEKVKQDKQRSAQKHPEKAAERSRRFHTAHPGRAAIYREKWLVDHPEEMKRAREVWAQENPNRRRILQGRRRARMKNQFIEDVDHRVVYEMHGGCCGICKDYVAPDNFHVDHIVPVSKGGMHGYINVQPSHPNCNRRKAAKCEL